MRLEFVDQPDEHVGGVGIARLTIRLDGAGAHHAVRTGRKVFIDRVRNPTAGQGGGAYADEASPTIPSMSRAMSRSFCVMPPSECVTSTKVTVRQRMSISE